MITTTNITTTPMNNKKCNASFLLMPNNIREHIYVTDLLRICSLFLDFISHLL